MKTHETEEYAIALPKGSELVEQVNQALADLKADGTFDVHHPNMHLAQTSSSNFVEKIKKTCKNLLTKVILLAIIIKLSRVPSPRRQPLEHLPTACTPVFEENFFKILLENLLTSARI